MTETLTNPCPEPLTCTIAVELANLRGEVHALGENVKALKASSEAAFARGEKLMDDHDKRIDSVEKKVWYATGAVSVVTAVVTAVMTKIFGEK